MHRNGTPRNRMKIHCKPWVAAPCAKVPRLCSSPKCQQRSTKAGAAGALHGTQQRPAKGQRCFGGRGPPCLPNKRPAPLYRALPVRRITGQACSRTITAFVATQSLGLGPLDSLPFARPSSVSTVAGEGDEGGGGGGFPLQTGHRSRRCLQAGLRPAPGGRALALDKPPPSLLCLCTCGLLC